MAEPVSKFLRRMGQEAVTDQRAINLARTALNDAIHFGRPQAVIDDLARRLQALEGPPQVQVEVPRAALDPVSVEYAAIGGPRSWAEQRVMNSAGEAALESADGPTSEALDAIRSNALMAARLARMTPEQRAQSVAAVAFQAADDARAAKLAQAAAAERQRAQAKAVAGALGNTAMATAAGAITAGGIGAAAQQMRERAREREMQAQSDIADYRRLDSLKKMTGLDGLWEDGLPYPTDDISEIAAAMTQNIRGVTAPEPDIFTEDPEIQLTDEDPRAAIRRVIQQRYGR